MLPDKDNASPKILLVSLRQYNFPILPNLNRYTKETYSANYFIQSLSDFFSLAFPFLLDSELVT